MLIVKKQKLMEYAAFFVFTIIMFQNALTSVNDIFRYVDEVLFLLCSFYIFVSVFRSLLIKKVHAKMIMIMTVIILLGLLCNFFSDIERSVFMILLDIVYFTKDFVCFLAAVIFFSKHKISRDFQEILVNEVHLILLVAFICLCASQFVDIGMTGSARYGISSFQFVYSGPGMLSQYCIIFLFVLTADLQFNLWSLRRFVFFVILGIVWISTLRTRAFVSIAIWCFFMFIGKDIPRDSRINMQIARDALSRFKKPRYVIIAIVVVVAVGWSQVQTYFGGETTARALLLSGGIAIMKAYFPLGSGFGTYGTEVAASWYSPLYHEYELDTFWALKKGGSELTDCYWPAVGAELGVFGIILMGLLIYYFVRAFLVYARKGKYYAIAVLTYIVYLLISSTATGIFSSYVTAGFLIICVAVTNVEEIGEI